MKAVPPDLSDRDPHNWDFSEVSTGELEACCWWEYARESKFIREVKRRCEDPKAMEMTNSQLWKYCGNDIERIQSIGFPSEVFLRGFFFPPGPPRGKRHPHAPPISGNFPCPWQSLSKEERTCRSHIQNDIEQCRLVPVRMGHWSTAKEIVRYCQSVADRQQSKLAVSKETRLDPIRPGVFWGVPESLIVEIAWEHFTNDEIATYFRKWIKHARPATVPEPDRRGHKRISDRVSLERLAILRLLKRYRPSQIRELCPAAWKRYGNPNRRWLSDAKTARDTFRKLFPLLPPNEVPLSWPPR